MINPATPVKIKHADGETEQMTLYEAVDKFNEYKDAAIVAVEKEASR